MTRKEPSFFQSSEHSTEKEAVDTWHSGDMYLLSDQLLLKFLKCKYVLVLGFPSLVILNSLEHSRLSVLVLAVLENTGCMTHFECIQAKIWSLSEMFSARQRILLVFAYLVLVGEGGWRESNQKILTPSSYKYSPRRDLSQCLLIVMWIIWIIHFYK